MIHFDREKCDIILTSIDLATDKILANYLTYSTDQCLRKFTIFFSKFSISVFLFFHIIYCKIKFIAYDSYTPDWVHLGA